MQSMVQEYRNIGYTYTPDRVEKEALIFEKYRRLFLILFAVGNGLMWPSFMSILSRRAGSKLQGAVQGVAGSFGGLASIVGLTLGGFLYNSVGGDTFLISGGVIFAVFIMSFRLLKLN